MAKESMKDLEKQVAEDSMDRRINPAEAGGVVAAKMNLGLKNWRLLYWLIATSVIVVTNHKIHAAPKLIPPELAMFALFLCGTGLLFLSLKKQMM